MKTSDLQHVHYFVEVADSGSFSPRHGSSAWPPSLVSRRIAKMEAELGARLFQRTTRSLALTDAGRAFLEHARAGLQSFALAREVIGGLQGVVAGRVRRQRTGRPRGDVVVGGVALSRAAPGGAVEIDLSDRYVDLIGDRFDLAIRSGAEQRSDRLIGRRLSDAPRLLVASPAYLDAHGTPRTVKDLRLHAAVILGPRSDRVTWLVHIGRRSESVVVDGRVAVNEARVAADCAADGFGIGFLPLAACAGTWRADVCAAS